MWDGKFPRLLISWGCVNLFHKFISSNEQMPTANRGLGKLYNFKALNFVY